MSALKYTPGPLLRGYYQPTPKFRAIAEHVAVMRPSGALVAVTGPSGEPQSEADALLYAAAVELLAEAKVLHCLATSPRFRAMPVADALAELRANGCGHDDGAAIAKAEGRS